MTRSFITITLFFSFLICSVVTNAQEKKVLCSDVFKGNISAGADDDVAHTLLNLQHEKDADMGTFTLDELFPGTKFSKPAHIVTTGDWTVLKGSAANKNDRVVELNAKGGRILYFLRLKNKDLQQLDFGLHEIPPASRHILKKQ